MLVGSNGDGEAHPIFSINRHYIVVYMNKCKCSSGWVKAPIQFLSCYSYILDSPINYSSGLQHFSFSILMRILVFSFSCRMVKYFQDHAEKKFLMLLVVEEPSSKDIFTFSLNYFAQGSSIEESVREMVVGSMGAFPVTPYYMSELQYHRNIFRNVYWTCEMLIGAFIYT